MLLGRSDACARPALSYTTYIPGIKAHVAWKDVTAPAQMSSHEEPKI